MQRSREPAWRPWDFYFPQSGQSFRRFRPAVVHSRESRCYVLLVLAPGDRVPHVHVWTAPREEARTLKQVLGVGLSLLCFYLWDWSPT